MKKIIISGSMAVAVAALVTGATVAFFNDTETSTGNTLTAGSIDLTVDSFGAMYNGVDVSQQQTVWTARDLTTQKFFTFEDVKPGDHGRRHISLHADSNEAYACLLLANKSDQENVRTDPEIDAGDSTDVPGELSSNIEIFAWQDNDSDLNYEPQNLEAELPRNGSFAVDSFFDITYDIDIADSTSGTPVLVPTGPAATRNVGIAWCVGNMNVNQGDGTITCNGAGGDKAQTDSFEADVVLYAEQVRNNPNFKCEDVDLNPQS